MIVLLLFSVQLFSFTKYFKKNVFSLVFCKNVLFIRKILISSNKYQLVYIKIRYICNN